MKSMAFQAVPATEAFEVIRGVTYDKGDARTSPADNFIPILRAGNIGDFALDINCDLVFVPSRIVRDEQRLRVGDIVMATSSGSASVVGKNAVLKQAWPGSFGAFCACLRPKEGWNADYLAFFLQTSQIRGLLSERARGVNINNLRRDHITSLLIPRPATEQEQREIVVLLEIHFSRLDAAVASLTRAKTNVKRARASVLKAAVEGRLVPTEAALARAEGRDYEPASALLARILTERRARWAENGGKGKYKEPAGLESEKLATLPEGWIWASLGQIVHAIEAGKSFSAENTPPTLDQVGIMKVSAVTWGRYDEMESKTVHDPAQVNADYFASPGDFLFSRANTIDLVGAAVIVERVTRRVMLSDKILRLQMPDALKRWVLWVLRSQHGRRQIESLATGNQESMRNIGQDRIRQIAIPLPPLAEQRRIVAEVDRRLSVLDALDATIDANLARCAKLRQSILKRAFDGRLVRPEAPAKGKTKAPQISLFTEEATA